VIRIACIASISFSSVAVLLVQADAPILVLRRFRALAGVVVHRFIHCLRGLPRARFVPLLKIEFGAVVALLLFRIALPWLVRLGDASPRRSFAVGRLLVFLGSLEPSIAARKA
jgi:hypothetical protein